VKVVAQQLLFYQPKNIWHRYSAFNI